MSDHLDLDALADALAADTSTRGADGHLAGCAACTSRLEELRGAEQAVRTSLAQLGDPPLPTGLTERITAALAADQPGAAGPAGTAGTAGTAGGVRSATVTPLQPRRRWAPLAAAAVMVVAVGGIGYSVVRGSGTGGGDQATASSADTGGQAEAAALPPVPTSDSGVDYATQVQVERGASGVLAGGATTYALNGAGGELRSEDQKAASSPGELSSLAPAGGTAGRATEDRLAASALDRLREPVALQECLSAVLPPEEPGTAPLALDYAAYQGKPALAVWLSDPDPGKLSVFVVGPQCSATDAALLFFTRVDRP